MSEIRVNTIVAAEGTSAPRLPYGVSVPTGMGVTGAGGVNISGIVTAAGFYDTDGNSIVGSAATLNVRTKSLTVSGVSTFTGAVDIDSTTDSTSTTTGALIIDGGLAVAKNVYIGAGMSIAGTLTYEDVTNVDSVGVGTFGKGVDVTAGGIDITAGGIDVTGIGTFSTNISVGGEVAAASLDISGSVDIDGTCEADAYTVNGTALNSYIAGITVTNATNATNSTNSTHVYVTDNESTNEDNLITFVEDATSSTGNVGLEMDGNLTYNPSTGRLTATQLSGTLQTAAQTNITSLGTLTGLTISGDVTFTGDNYNLVYDKSDNALEFSDNARAKFGNGNDLHIYHSGSDSYIDEDGTGDLYIRSGSNNIIKVDSNLVTLYYQGSVKLQTTNDGVNVSGMTTLGEKGSHLQGMLREDCNITAGTLGSNTNIDLEDGMVHYFSSNETGTSTPNIRWNSSYSLNNKMSTGEIVTVTIITKPNGAGYQASLNVDGSGVTEEWLGGSAPSSANAGGYDVMTHSLIKTSSGAFLCLSNVQNYA